MGKIFVTSDTHYYHHKIIKYCNRPFRDAYEMNQVMIDNWNKTVTEDDIVYHLGDVAFAKPYQTKDIFDKLKAKRKILIAGNHDYGQQALNTAYWKTMFDEVHQYYEIKYRNLNFVLFHFPMKEWNRKYHGSIHLHGHTHNRSQEKTSDLIYDVGVDGNNFTPVDLNHIIDIMSERKKSDEKV